MKTTESLGDRIKHYEASFELEIKPLEEMIIRIDGHHFSQFTKNFEAPFDNLFKETMVRTTEDLVQRFNAYAGYSQSDEITLYVPSISLSDKRKGTNVHQFGGRTQKIASLVAAYTTVKFNYHLRTLIKHEETTEEKVNSARINMLYSKLDTAYFDARVFGVPDKSEAYNSFMFRSRDNEKNSKSQFCQAYCSHKELLNKNGQEQVEYCLDKTGKDWNSLDDMFKYGTLIKKELYEKPVDFRDLEYGDRAKWKTPEQPTVTRSKLIRIYKKFTEFTEENINLICSQYYKEDL